MTRPTMDEARRLEAVVRTITPDALDDLNFAIDMLTAEWLEESDNQERWEEYEGIALRLCDLRDEIERALQAGGVEFELCRRAGEQIRHIRRTEAMLAPTEGD